MSREQQKEQLDAVIKLSRTLPPGEAKECVQKFKEYTFMQLTHDNFESFQKQANGQSWGNIDYDTFIQEYMFPETKHLPAEEAKQRNVETLVAQYFQHQPDDVIAALNIDPEMLAHSRS